MSNKELTTNDIFDIRDAMAGLAKDISDYLISNQSIIPAIVARDLDELAFKIRGYVRDLTDIAIIGGLTTDLEESAKNIQQAIQRLGEALKQINDFNKFLSQLASLTNIFSTIVRAASLGLGSVDLNSAFKSLDDLFT